MEYLKLLLEYQEIYDKEIMKGAMISAGQSYQDAEKNNLANKIKKALAQKNKLDQLDARQQEILAGTGKNAADVDREDEGLKRKELEKESTATKTGSQQVEGSLNGLLAKWKEKYPSDADLFESAAKIDLQAIQNALTDTQAVLIYFPMNDALNVVSVTKEGIDNEDIPISAKDLTRLIRDRFYYENIELYKHPKIMLKEKEYLDNCNQVLNELYKVLVYPIEHKIAGKNEIIVVPNKYISYVPFSALVKNIGIDGKAEYLVYDKTITYIRLSFFRGIEAASPRPVEQTPDRSEDRGLLTGRTRIIAIGNPFHSVLHLPDLKAAVVEVENVEKTAEEKGFKMDAPLIGKDATETAWKEKVGAAPYDVFYFATHGVTSAEIQYFTHAIREKVGEIKQDMGKVRGGIMRELKSELDKYEQIDEFCSKVFIGKSPLNGFLYMADSPKDEGVLTLTKILKMDEKVFENAKLAVLSACNTAVSYSPTVNPQEGNELAEGIGRELVAAGWVPGVDQVCLVDTFMKRNFRNVVGTLWSVDDNATAAIMGDFFNGLDRSGPAKSLRQAQLAYLAASGVPLHPYYWAAFATFGTY